MNGEKIILNYMTIALKTVKTKTKHVKEGYLLAKPFILKRVSIIFLKSLLDFRVVSPHFRGKIIGRLYENIQIAEGVKLRSNINFYQGGEWSGSLTIGQNSFINEECFLDCSSELHIGKNVAIGMRTVILSSSHHLGSPVRCGRDRRLRTVIGDDTWIGASVVIHPGVVVGKGCVIAAGEVVRESIPDHHILKAGKLVAIDESRIEDKPQP